MPHRFKKKLARTRPKIYVKVSLAKMILIIGCMIAFMYNDYGFYNLFDFTNENDS